MPLPSSVVCLNWTVRPHADGQGCPAQAVPAQLPGAVQLDWARAHGLPSIHDVACDLERDYGWMARRHWTYRTRIENLPSLVGGQRLRLRGQGIDYHFLVRLDGHLLLAQEGMFSPFDLDLTERVRSGSELDIEVLPAPDSGDRATPYAAANQSCKPPVSWGWDWHPRVIPLGVWKPLELVVVPADHLLSQDFTYRLNPSLDRATCTLALALAVGSTGGRARWRLLDPRGGCVREQTMASAPALHAEFTVEQPSLWWPHDHGPQARYTLEIELLDASGLVVERHRRRVGFRRVRLVMNAGEWERKLAFPKPRNRAPFQLEINGRAIFCKGTNWVNPEVFPGTITEATYEPLLQLARQANFNLLRCWGGAIVNHDCFFERCDALGLLVWQEFPLSCSNYRDHDRYLEVLAVESRAIIRQVRAHPCLAFWSGGNELFQSWSLMTDQHRALRLLNARCLELDPETPFIPTSPIEGVGHGDYRFRDDQGREVHQIYREAGCTAYTEYGVPGAAPVEDLRAIIPPGELFPPKLGTTWVKRHGFGAWDIDSTTWLTLTALEHYFGPSHTLEEMVERSRFLQAEGYRLIFEEARRQKPYCSMALNWCYNEPWVCAANNSLISYPTKPKPAFETVAAACRPTLVALRLDKFTWAPGEELTVEPWILHDAWCALPAARVEVVLDLPGVAQPVQPWQAPATEANRNQGGPILRWLLPARLPERFRITVRVPEHPEWESVYHCLRAL